MVIILKKLGLTEESSFEQIQTALTGLTVYSDDEVKKLKDTAAAGARKAEKEVLTKQFEKNSLTEEQMKEYNAFKATKVKTGLKSNKTLAKFEDDFFDLLNTKYKLDTLDMESDEFKTAIKEITTKYGKQMKNDVPAKVEKSINDKISKDETSKEDKNDKQKENYVPGSLGIFDDKPKEE